MLTPGGFAEEKIVHFSSHKGAEVFSIYGSLVETCKMAGISIKQYLIRVIKEINGGNKNSDSLIPGILAN